MTRAMLLRSVLSVMAFLTLLLVVAIYAKSRELVPNDPASRFWESLYAGIKDFTGLLIAIPGAWLAYCFSRRSAFLTILDGLWRDMVEAKGKCIDYSVDPTPDRLIAARAALSTVIDNMRSVYRNVGETEKRIGLFPFEPLHDMNRTLKTYAPRIAAATPAERAAIQSELRAVLVDSWNGLRHSFLREFGAPEPTSPITAYGFHDPRRRRRGPPPPQASSSTSQ